MDTARRLQGPEIIHEPKKIQDKSSFITFCIFSFWRLIFSGKISIYLQMQNVKKKKKVKSAKYEVKVAVEGNI